MIPSLDAWEDIEKAPEMTAWEAMTVAMVATTTSGTVAQLGASR